MGKKSDIPYSSTMKDSCPLIEPLPDTSDSAPCDTSGSSRGVSGVGIRMVLSVSDSLISDENQAISH